MKFWIIYSAKLENHSSPILMSEEASRQGLDHSLFFYEYFSIKTEDGKKRLFYKDEVIQHYPDVVLFRGYNHGLMKLLEQKGAMVINNAQTALLSKDKWMSHQLLGQHGIQQPTTLLVDENSSFDGFASSLGKPFVLKDRTGQKGHNVFLIENQTQYKQALENNTSFLAQQYVKNSHGTDVRVFVVGDKLFGMRRTNNTGGFKTNLAEGIICKPISLNKQQKNLAKNIASILGLKIGSVDFLVDGNNWVFCEANSNAAFSSFTFFNFDMRKEFMQYIKEHYATYQNPHEQNKRLRKQDGDHLVMRGSNDIVVSAPHNVKQIRSLKIKGADLGTGDLVLAIHEQTNAHAIIKTKCVGIKNVLDDDANWQTSHPYRDSLVDLINQENIHYLLDIHSLKKERPEQICLGINGGINVQGNTALVRQMEQIFKKHYKVSIDNPFSAPAPTICEAMAQKGVFCVQIEINSTFIDSDCDENNFQTMLQCFKQVINLLENQAK